MRKIIGFILAVFICCPAIAKHKQHKKHGAGNEIISVQLYRTGCFGRCPTYKAEINKSGMVTYDAIRFNADSGVFQKNIGAAKAMEILNEVDSYRPDTCRDEYENRVADLPGINFTIQYPGKTKHINNATDGPGFLQLLARDIDAAGKKTDDIGWQKATTSPRK